VLIVHGCLQRGSQFRALAKYLATNGMSCATFDLRGHGLSSGKRAFVEDWNDFAEDLTAALATFDETTPRFLLGHSMGGLLILDYFLDGKGKGPVRGLILDAPALGVRNSALYKMMFFCSKFFRWLFPGVPFSTGNRLAPEKFTHDPEMIQEYADDAHRMKELTPSLIHEILKTQFRIQEREWLELNCSLLVIAGEEDEVVDNETNQEITNRIAQADKEWINRAGERHDPLHEVNREELFATLLAWISQRAVPEME
jgi:alpha-beta hydrolase superfamily lysophospholipase